MAKATATMPIAQLALAPMAPSMPPPIGLKRLSSGATVWPVVTHQAAPRQISRPPSVTMKEETPR